VAAPALQCPYGYAVTATNNTGRDVDVWQGRKHVGTVLPGTTSELSLERPDSVSWAFPPQNPPRYYPYTDVTLHVHCR
jgi:hypothetical protein